MDKINNFFINPLIDWRYAGAHQEAKKVGSDEGQGYYLKDPGSIRTENVGLTLVKKVVVIPVFAVIGVLNLIESVARTALGFIAFPLAFFDSTADFFHEAFVILPKQIGQTGLELLVESITQIFSARIDTRLVDKDTKELIPFDEVVSDGDNAAFEYQLTEKGFNRANVLFILNWVNPERFEKVLSYTDEDITLIRESVDKIKHDLEGKYLLSLLQHRKSDFYGHYDLSEIVLTNNLASLTLNIPIYDLQFITEKTKACVEKVQRDYLDQIFKIRESVPDESIETIVGNQEASFLEDYQNIVVCRLDETPSRVMDSSNRETGLVISEEEEEYVPGEEEEVAPSSALLPPGWVGRPLSPVARGLPEIGSHMVRPPSPRNRTVRRGILPNDSLTSDQTHRTLESCGLTVSTETRASTGAFPGAHHSDGATGHVADDEGATGTPLSGRRSAQSPYVSGRALSPLARGSPGIGSDDGSGFPTGAKTPVSPSSQVIQ